MFGLVTRSAADLDHPHFERVFFEVKDVTGRRSDPIAEGINMVSCHGDTQASADPDLVAINDEDEPATRDRRYFDWGYVCPTHEGYRTGLVELIEGCVEVNDNLRLDDVGFPRAEYCFCERCTRAFETSTFTDRFEWRASVITNFVEQAAERIPGRTYLTVYPDPYPGHLEERSGLNPPSVERYVDEIVIPIYDLHYATTYWLEILAKGFQELLSIPFGIELYAVDIDIESLVHAAEVAGAYADHVYFAYDTSNALKAIEQLEGD